MLEVAAAALTKKVVLCCFYFLAELLTILTKSIGANDTDIRPKKYRRYRYRYFYMIMIMIPVLEVRPK